MTLLPNDVREEFENLFHADLGGVRVHESAGVARLRTLAGACGEHIYVLPGVLERDDAREIVAHEVAHVLQQRAGRLRPGAEHDLEAEAMAAGRAVAAGRPFQLRGYPGADRCEAFQGYSVVTPAGRAAFGGGVAVVNGHQNLVAPFTADSFPGQDRNGNGFQASSFLLARHGAPVLSSADPALVNLRVSAGGRMAIEQADLLVRQPKVFYATQSIIDDSNQRLAALGSPFRLVPDPALPAPAQRRITIGVNVLLRVMPWHTGNGTQDLTTKTIQACNQMIESVIGATNPVPRTGNLNPVPHPLFVEYNLARELVPPPLPGPVDDTSDATRGASMRAIVSAYGAALRGGLPAFTAAVQAARVNEFADPRVGEGFLTTALLCVPAGVPIPPGPLSVEDHAHWNGAGPSVVDRDRKWETHWGAVVASDGNDVITLENYARSYEDDLETDDTRFYFQMYSIAPLAPGSWHSEWTSTPMRTVAAALAAHAPVPAVPAPPYPAVTHVPVMAGVKSFANPITVRVTVPDSRLETIAATMHPTIAAIKNDHNLVGPAATADAEFTNVLKGLRYANAHLANGDSGDRTRVLAWRAAVNAAIANDRFPMNRHALQLTRTRLMTMTMTLV